MPPNRVKQPSPLILSTMAAPFDVRFDFFFLLSVDKQKMNNGS